MGTKIRPNREARDLMNLRWHGIPTRAGRARPLGEGVTEKIGDLIYVSPDANVSLVPNVGIVVGSRATLVIDPSSITDTECYGRRS